jgi:thiol-disulfide isomerase/thioredoxin
MSDSIDQMTGLPSLGPPDFEGANLRRDGRTLVFFYARWCPYCRASIKNIHVIKDKGYSSYSVDLSEDSNPLWGVIGIDIVPALIGYADGREIHRKQSPRMVGLGESDFEAADEAMSE